MTNNAPMQYIDFEAATIKAIRDMSDMLWKLEHSKESIEEIDTRVTSPKGGTLSLAPAKGAGEPDDAWADAIDKRDLIEAGYEQAKNYGRWFMPCWDRLSSEEQTLLLHRYCGKGARGIPWTETIFESGIYVERAEAYNRSNEALAHLRKLLYP